MFNLNSLGNSTPYYQPDNSAANPPRDEEDSVIGQKRLPSHERPEEDLEKKAKVDDSFISDEQKKMIIAEISYWPDESIFESPESWPSYFDMLEFLGDCDQKNDQSWRLLNLLIKFSPHKGLDDGLDELMRYVAYISDSPETLKLLLERGANVDSIDDHDGRTALIYAANCGHLKSVELLIEHGADVNASDHFDVTALAAVAHAQFDREVENVDWRPMPYGHEICRLLIENGAKVNVLDQEGNSPLSNAALTGQGEICQLLLDAKAELGDINKLLRQATFGNVRFLCEMLLQLDAYPHVRDNVGSTAVLVAAYCGNFELLKLFPLDQTPKEDLDRLLCFAAGHPGSEQLCQFLITNGAHVNAFVEDSYYFQGDLKIVKQGWTVNPLACAVRSGNTSVCKLLLSQGANPNIRFNTDEGTYTALAIAAKMGFNEICSLLLSFQARLEDKSYRGQTALICAASKGRKTTCELLLNHGADINAESQEGSPLEAALRSGNIETCELLLKDRAVENLNGLLVFVCSDRFVTEPIKKVNWLIDLGADVNYVVNGCSVLRYALKCHFYDSAVIKCLRARGAIINPDRRPFPIKSKEDILFSFFNPLRTDGDFLIAQKRIITAIKAITATCFVKTSQKLPRDVLYLILKHVPESLDCAFGMHKNMEFRAPHMSTQVIKKLIKRGHFNRDKAVKAIKNHKVKLLESLIVDQNMKDELEYILTRNLLDSL